MLRRMPSILQLRTLDLKDSGSMMKVLVRIAVPLLAAAFCLVPALHAQPAMQAGGMADIQAHSVRGDVTAITGNTITVKTEEGQVYTIQTGPNTRFRKQRDPIQIGEVHTGDMIAAVGDKDVKARTMGAAFVMVIDKARYEQMRAGFGKTWTAGVVQSIEGTNIMIKRADGQTQTIAVDENTSFRRRREDITLPDIKAGETIGARGALHNGAFLATLVNVGRRGEGGYRAGAREAEAPAHATNPQTHATQIQH
jgi:hypothetical protein